MTSQPLSVMLNPGVLCQKQVSRAGTSNYTLQYLWDVITCPCPWYLLRSGTTLQILWDVITCPCPWYLLQSGTTLQILWDVITCPCPWYLLRAHPSWIQHDKGWDVTSHFLVPDITRVLSTKLSFTLALSSPCTPVLIRSCPLTPS